MDKSNIERFWRYLGGEGTYAHFTLHDTVDFTEVVCGPEQIYIRLDPSQDLVDQVASIGLMIDGTDNGEYGVYAASYARIITLSADGKKFPEEDDITVTVVSETIRFGRLIPKEGAFIEDTRGEPKADASLDPHWVCATRCGIKQRVMKTDVVVATPLQETDVAGKIIYKEGRVSNEWLEIVHRLQPSRSHHNHTTGATFAPAVKG